MRHARPRPGRIRATGQRGAALLVALFVMALAVLIVSDLVWRQFVLRRTVENQQVGAQSRLLLSGAEDWARLILQDQTHPAYDALSDPWAQPLAPTPLDQLGDTAPLVAQATIEGAIVDAQARFNLRNLLDSAGNINPVQLAVLEKLAGLLNAPSGTGKLVATYLAQCYAGAGLVPGQTAAANQAAISAAFGPAGGGVPTAVVPLASSTRPLPPVLPEDLAGIPGIDPAAALALAPYVVLLDQTNTTVNFNTASALVMAASIPDLSLNDANTLAAERDRAYFVSVGDIQNRLNGRGGNLTLVGVSTNSSYFMVQGTVHLGRAATQLTALLRRTVGGTQGRVIVLWERAE
jgi:general secretion pathway protein K